MKTHKEYRVARKQSHEDPDDGYHYMLGLVDVDKKGNVAGTFQEAYPAGDSVNELKACLEKMMQAFDKPVMEHPWNISPEEFKAQWDWPRPE